MKKLLVVALVIIAGIVGFRMWDKAQTERSARLRVESIVRAVANRDEQMAIGLWAENTERPDSGLLSAYSEKFSRFWSESGLSAAPDWSVTNTESVGHGEVVVTLESGSAKVSLRVPPYAPIAVAPGV